MSRAAAERMALSRSKLDQLSQKLQSEDGFSGFMLSAARVSADKQAAAARTRNGQKSALLENVETDEEAVTQNHMHDSEQHVQAPGSGVDVSRGALDMTTDSVSGSLLHWRAPSRLYVWGRGMEGQLGCGTVNAQAAVSRVVCPMRVAIGEGAPAGHGEAAGSAAQATQSPGDSVGFVDTVPIRVASGRRVTAIVDNKRKLWAMGEGFFGRGKKERCHWPVVVGGLEKHAVVEVALGMGFMLACTVDGVALVWGENEGVAKLEATADKNYRRDVNFLKQDKDNKLKGSASPTKLGQDCITSGTAQGHPLGMEPGSPYKVPLPKPMTALKHEQVISVASGEAHLVALCASGRVYTWGGGSSGATGQGITTTTWTPTAVQLRTPARVRQGARGSAIHANVDGVSESVPRATAFSALTARERRKSIAEVDGVQAAGNMGLGKVAKLGAGRRNSKSQDAGSAAGTQAEESKYACAISAGSHHTAILARDGTVHVMGFGESGRLGLGNDLAEPVTHPTPIRGAGIPTFTSIACGGAHTLFVSADGRLFACGDNSFGQSGVNTREQATIFERLAGGGEVVHAERRVLVPRQIFTPVFGDVIVVKVVAGSRHSGCMDLFGSMWAWGLNEEGSCGSGDEVTSPEPAKVARFREVRVIQASLGDAHTAAIVSRARHIPPGASVSQLDDDDASGAAMTLEPPLPLNLRRERRQQLNVRRKAIAFCFARKRRLAKLARKRLLRRMVSQHLQRSDSVGAYSAALAAAAAASTSENSVAVVHTSRSEGEPADEAVVNVGRHAQYEKTAPGRRQSNGDGGLPAHPSRSDGDAPMMMQWELDPDSSVYGRNSAATIIQGLFRRLLTAVQSEKRQQIEAWQSLGSTQDAKVLNAGGAVAGDETPGISYRQGYNKQSAAAALTRLQSHRHMTLGGGLSEPEEKAELAPSPPKASDEIKRTVQMAALHSMGFSSITVNGAL